ncbi:MAG: hypothetical protein R2715_22090 [Ilumatobacteraceae bacterium]
MRLVDDQLFDTDHVVTTAHETLDDPAVQSVLRTELDRQITEQVGAPFASVVDLAVSRVLADPRFDQIFDLAVRETHSMLVGGNRSTLVFDLSAAVPVIEQGVAQVDPRRRPTAGPHTVVPGSISPSATNCPGSGPSSIGSTEPRSPSSCWARCWWPWRW